MASQALHGMDFIGHLTDLGIVPEDTRRVIIEASIHSLVIVYVEQLGTKDLIKIEAPCLEGAKVVIAKDA